MYNSIKMKKIFLLSAVSIATALLGSYSSFAQEKEKIVTGSITIHSPSNVKVLDEFISDQLYSGKKPFTGLEVRLGAMYRKQDNLSWDLNFTRYNRPNLINKFESASTLTNPANSQKLKYSSYSIGYGTYYHWLFGEKLMIKAGGVFDVYGAMKTSTPDGVNNSSNIEGQLMVKAHGAIKYGWDFKKWALDLHALLTLPVVGIITADHPYEPAVSILSANDHSVMDPAYKHIFLASYHNYMSLDYEVGIDFVLKHFTITAGFGSTGKWWNIYDIQNIRRINYSTIGISFDLVSRNKFKSPNKNF